MARMMNAKPRRRDGKGIGERLSEIAVYILVIGALAYAVNWYFNVYTKSPGLALQRFLADVRSGNPEAQYDMLTADSKSAWSSPKAYATGCPLSHAFAGGRLNNYVIASITQNGDKAEADVSLSVGRTSEELYQAISDTFSDHFVLTKEADGWKVQLNDKSGSKLYSTAQKAPRSSF